MITKMIKGVTFIVFVTDTCIHVLYIYYVYLCVYVREREREREREGGKEGETQTLVFRNQLCLITTYN